MPSLKIKNITINAIIFDFNGTLARLNIDFQQMRRAVFDLISSYNINPAELPSDHILEIIHHVSGILNTKSGTAALSFTSNAYEIIEQQEIAAARNGGLFGRTRDLLARLAACGIRTAIITRNCTAAINIEFPDIVSYCPVVICRDQVKNVKPHPDHLNKALNLLAVSPDSSLMVGDHPLDIKPGKIGGTLTAGVLTGNFSANDFLQSGADIVLPEATDILDMLQ